MVEVVRWGSALLTLIGFGLAMGLNPALYAATADMLARDVKVTTRLCWMLFGLAGGATLLLLIFHSFDPTNIVAAFRGRFDAALVNRTIDLVVAGLFLLAAALVTWWKLRVPELRTKPKKTPKTRSAGYAYFFIGLSACIGFTTLPIMYLTGRLITTLSSDLVIRVIAYGVFLLALAAPFVALVAVWSKFPALTAKATGLYVHAARWDYRRALIVLLVLAGALFLGLALLAPRGL